MGNKHILGLLRHYTPYLGAAPSKEWLFDMCRAWIILLQLQDKVQGYSTRSFIRDLQSLALDSPNTDTGCLLSCSVSLPTKDSAYV